ncbi:MAG: DUF763 domain-containing protein [Nitrososphaeria archaeon]
MSRSGIADLPLHYGRCPHWLFPRMVKLSKAISEAIILEFGRNEFLRRLADPYFFQSLSCVVGFDWHSSGTTTTLTGALKEALNAEELGIAVCGGKGKASKETLSEIEKVAEKFPLSTDKVEHLQYTSKIVAKVDTSAIQSGYQLYHHALFVDEQGRWTIIQQGLNPDNRYARRYHWYHGKVENFVVEPHSAIVSDKVEKYVLNLTSKISLETQETIVDIARENPRKVAKMWQEILDRSNVTLLDWVEPGFKKFNLKHLCMPRNIDWKIARRLYETQPRDFEEVLMTENVGPKMIRALTLISNLIYGTEVDWKDPVKYSFAVGGKDGVPFPVDRETYDRSITVLKTAIENAKMEKDEQIRALRRIGIF